MDETEQAWQLSFVENEMDALLLLSKGMKQTLRSRGEESTFFVTLLALHILSS